MRVLVILLSSMVLGGCAVFPAVPPTPPLGDRQAAEIVSRIREEESKVVSFYGRGNLLVKEWTWEADSDLLVVGAREPWKVKIEVTHRWGQPILHVLMDRRRLEVLFFPESRLYVGDSTPEALSRFFPGPLSTDLVWAVLRGYPAIVPHEKVFSPHGRRIVLRKPGEGEGEIIDLDHTGLHPARVELPDQHVLLTFSDIRESGGIHYARVVRVDHEEDNRTLTLTTERMVFNRAIPAEIFRIEKPPGFSVHYLNTPDPGRP
ncbi:MAG: hypothetical protein JXL84_16645 [Deltaproteobacteria bacterium]|nr:hypothetical protein [Deltaproteobacteria bacterium]